MYLMGFVNSAFETRRPTGNLELVDLSLEKKYHPPELPVARRKEHSNGHSQSCRMINGNGNGTYTKTENGNSNNSNSATLKTSKPIAIQVKPSRRRSLEDLPADLYMEPLSPLLLRSPDGAHRRSKTSSWVPEETPVNWLREDLASQPQELDQEWWSFCIGKPSKRSTVKKPTSRWTSTFESVFADGGISIRVQHHPLEVSSSSSSTEEDESRDASPESETGDTVVDSLDTEFCEKITEGANVNRPADEGLEHLESEEKAELQKLPSTNTEPNCAISSPELGIEQPGLQESKAVPIAASPRNSRLGDGNVEPHADLAKLPSLSSPVMERMEAVAASLESPYSWNKKRVAMSGVHSESPTREERDLRYPTPKMNDLLQEELSFRLWDREATPTWTEFRDEQDCGFPADECARNESPTLKGGDDEIVKKRSPPNVDALMNLRTLDLRSRRRATATAPLKVEVDVQSEQDYPSPSSFTYGLSPTSLFSDDPEPFRLSVSSRDDNMIPTFQQCRSRVGSREEIRNGFRKSPRSVLSQEPDEISHETSDSSDTSGKKHQQKQQQTSSDFKYLYNDESSDLESPMQSKFKYQLQQPFPTFTYSVGKDMGVTSSSSSSSDEDGNVDAGSLQELGFFQEANHWEPWLVNDGGVLYDSEDLEFLLSPDFKCKDATKSVPVRKETSPSPSAQLRIGFRSLSRSPTSEEMPQSTDGITKHGSPKTKHGSPKTKHDSPKTKHDSPKTKHDSPKTKHDSPKTKLDSPKPKLDSPKPKLDSPKTKLDSPKTKLDSPKTKLDSPKTKLDSPKTKLDSPKTKHESPKIKYDSLRRPTSENKWVPYVTGSNLSRVRNPMRGGSQPQSPNFDKTTHQGKASLTKSSTEKAPKRSVNFAPDLVREIPYSTTPTPAPTPAAPPDRKQQQPRPNPNVKKEDDKRAPPPAPALSKAKAKTWEVDDEEEGPSIMNSRRHRWRRNRDDDDDKSPRGSMSFSRGRDRVAQAVPSCAGRLFAWPRRLALKVKRGRGVDSDDDGSRAAGDRSFGVSSRRDAELVRRILKGSQKKYSNLTGDDILKDDLW